MGEYDIIKFDEGMSAALIYDEDFNYGYFPTNVDGYANLDLNNGTLSITSNSLLKVGGSLTNKSRMSNITISNGKIKLAEGQHYGYATIKIAENSSLTLKNVTMEVSYNSGESARNTFEVLDNANLTLINCKIVSENTETTSVFLGGKNSQTNIFDSELVSTAYGITTNADTTQSWDVRLKVENSNIITSNGASILVNVPGEYNFTNCMIEGNGEGAVIRGGNATFINCVIRNTGDNTKLLSTVFSNKENWEFSDVSKQIDGSPLKKMVNGKMVIWSNLVL